MLLQGYIRVDKWRIDQAHITRLSFSSPCWNARELLRAHSLYTRATGEGEESGGASPSSLLPPGQRCPSSSNRPFGVMDLIEAEYRKERERERYRELITRFSFFFVARSHFQSGSILSRSLQQIKTHFLRRVYNDFIASFSF